MGFEVRAPEVATVVRWILRLVLVGFLAWLVKGRQEEEPEEEEEQGEEANHDWGQRRTPARGPPRSSNSRDRRYDNQSQYSGLTQRKRPGNSGSDFDATIDKFSKPKQMWDVNRSSSLPQIAKPSPVHDSSNSKPTVVPKEKPSRAEQSEASSAANKELFAHERPVTWITWSRDGELLFTCGKESKVSVWKYPECCSSGQQKPLGSYIGHKGAVWACSVTADNRWLVTCGADCLVMVWEASESRELSRKEAGGVCKFVEWANSGAGSGSARFATVHKPFGKKIPSVITVWRFDGQTIEEQLFDGKGIELSSAATQVRWGRDDRFLASSHETGELIFWNAEDGRKVHQLQVHEASLSKFDFSSDRLLVATASTDMKVKVLDLGEEGSGEGKLLYEATTDRPLNAVSLGPLTRTVALGPESELPRCCMLIAAGGQDARDVALTDTGSEQFNALLFKIASGKLEAMDAGSMRGHFGPVHTLAFSADGSVMASGGEDGQVRLHKFIENLAKA